MDVSYSPRLSPTVSSDNLQYLSIDVQEKDRKESAVANTDGIDNTMKYDSGDDYSSMQQKTTPREKNLVKIFVREKDSTDEGDRLDTEEKEQCASKYPHKTTNTNEDTNTSSPKKENCIEKQKRDSVEGDLRHEKGTRIIEINRGLQNNPHSKTKTL